MAVADLLVQWKAAHTAAKSARYHRNLAENALKLAEARQCLIDAHAEDPSLTDPAWATLPCSVIDLETFYASQLDVDKVLAPRFTKSVEAEQHALASMKAQHDNALARVPRGTSEA